MVFILSCVFGFIILVAVVALIAYLVDKYDTRDDTDKPFPAKKSELILHIDARTGCHYLSTENGGLTPRLDRQGNHLREARVED